MKKSFKVIVASSLILILLLSFSQVRAETVRNITFNIVGTETEEVPPSTSLEDYIESKREEFQGLSDFDDEWQALYVHENGVYKYPKDCTEPSLMDTINSDDVTTEIYTANYTEVTVTKAPELNNIDLIDIHGFEYPLVGEVPDVSKISLPEGLTIENTSDRYVYWLLAEPDFSEVTSNNPFVEGKPYYLFIPYTVNEGYGVPNPKNIGIDGSQVGDSYKGWCEEGEIRLCFYPGYKITYDLNGATLGPIGKQPVDYITEATKTTVMEPPAYYCSPEEGMEFDGWEIDGVKYAPGDEITVDKSIIIRFLWKPIEGESESGEGPEEEHQGEQIEYKIPSVNKQATAIFTFNEGHEWTFVFEDILTMDPAFVEENFGVSAEEFNAILNTCKKQIEGYGNLLSLYAIEINGTDFNYSDKVQIRIKITDKMKEYDSFKLVYLNDENGFAVSEIVDLEVDKDNNEIVANLKHLSAYALIGEKTESSSNKSNPKTGDSITFDIVILIVSITGLIYTIVSNKNKDK